MENILLLSAFTTIYSGVIHNRISESLLLVVVRPPGGRPEDAAARRFLSPDELGFIVLVCCRAYALCQARLLRDGRRVGLADLVREVVPRVPLARCAACLLENVGQLVLREGLEI